MKKHLSIFSVLFLTTVLMSCNDAADDANNTNSDSAATTSTDTTSTLTTTPVDDETVEFMTKAAHGGMMEVQLGKLAGDKAKSDRVKAFGAMMVTDHTKAGEELKSLASQKNVTLPTSPSEEHQHHIDDLSKKTGTDFDKAYMKMMVENHEKVIDDFKKDSSDGKEADVKSWAAKTLPTLRKHLDSARNIRKQQ